MLEKHPWRAGPPVEQNGHGDDWGVTANGEWRMANERRQTVTTRDIAQALNEFELMLADPVRRAIRAKVSEHHPCDELMALEVEAIPWSNRHGVYYFTDAAEQVLYVGSARVKHFGDRFWCRVGQMKCRDGLWANATAFTMIRFHDHFYFAAALEGYILSKSQIPPLNMRR